MNEKDLSYLRAGYIRGLLATPLTVSDVGKTREELIAAYQQPGIDPVRTPIE